MLPMLMRSTMVLAFEAHIAIATLPIPFARVCDFVSLAHFIRAEQALAKATLYRLDSRMTRFMLFHEVRTRKPFATELAYRYPFACMYALVFHKRTRIRACVVARLALEWFFARMCALMHDKVTGRYEALVAVATLMRFVALMSRYMLF